MIYVKKYANNLIFLLINGLISVTCNLKFEN